MDNEFAQTAVEGPKQFVKDGIAFINRCTKPDRKGRRSDSAYHRTSRDRAKLWTLGKEEMLKVIFGTRSVLIIGSSSGSSGDLKDEPEFMQITQAVSMGFFVMGVIGFVVKLIHIPINNILVGGA
ncbi:Sec61p translocation complex subunit [Mortierella sp. AD011]|nr:Sec61p translocation complex subunit [Mortierella sp. AD010]KAF9388952.1 Sec61p translocation complex subunit [Mortierella sp. AD011]